MLGCQYGLGKVPWGAVALFHLDQLVTIRSQAHLAESIGHTLRDIDGLEAVATLEGLIANTCYAIGDGNTFVVELRACKWRVDTYHPKKHLRLV